mmetsp:Transcript_21746/g.31558  ORF Transcript_21746/g.31558 Transcript_21746/m.31558 type:complete len:129 (-) Transcript_21746:71-457(-)|eukprot:CAMPEP_0113937564 /NCGR_PEP_ID=MMETSP1339-20121228/4166_1 /TAXON_ID=94617 /ORGANISM="Fibrocapsa japonica" /LENGTH=128 /DNA_ID=CAMNT_0000940383 /DNA_START=81 /DNA_END=467 /DNA_ORIENTATION=- /assembly_acc=CAM_ASM_000762
MRRRGDEDMNRKGGNGQYSSAEDRIHDTNLNMMEMENNAKINELGDQISLLKDMTLEIGHEVERQNAFLDGMGTQMGDASGLLGSTMSKLGAMIKQGGSKHMCYLIAFVVFVFMAIWWIISHKGTDGS